jgi:hypothetical protein
VKMDLVAKNIIKKDKNSLVKYTIV